MELVKLSISDKSEVKTFFREVFTKDPGMMIGVMRNNWKTIS